METPYMAVTCSKELQEKLIQMQNKRSANLAQVKGIDLAASFVVAPSASKKNKKNKVAEFRDRLMGVR